MSQILVRETNISPRDQHGASTGKGGALMCYAMLHIARKLHAFWDFPLHLIQMTSK